ncbi:MAG: PadR family transcriptional regulator [Actinobacteria bacterium]|nr:PadR family transcriptional regulator [Actinomycetota bacterium]
MSTSDLSPFSYAVLGLVGDGGAAPHDIVRMMRQGRPYWTTSPSHYYAEPKRLEKLGYLAARKEPGRTRERTHYTLTDTGREALREWLARPSRFPRIQNEAAVRVMAGDLVDDAALVASLTAMRGEIDEMQSSLERAEEIAATLPHRERYLRLLHRLGHRLLAAHRDWIAELEAELGESPRTPEE